MAQSVSKIHPQPDPEEEIRRLHGLLEQAPGFFALVTGPDHVHALANAAYKRLVGRDDLVGKTVREVFPELEEQGFFRILDEAYNSGQAYFGKRVPVKFHLTKSDEWLEHFIEFTLQPFSYAGTRGVFIQGYDVSEHKHAEDELRISQQRAMEAMRIAETEKRRLDALLEAAPVGITMVDADGRIIRINKESRKIMGDEPIQDIGGYTLRKGWWSDSAGHRGERIKPEEWALARALHGEETVRDVVEIEPYGEPGVHRHVLISGAPVHDIDGKIIGSVAAKMDISDRINAERALRDSEAMFRTIANAMPQMVWSTRADGHHDYFNDRWYEFTGTQPDSTNGFMWKNLLHPDDTERTSAAWGHSVKTGAPYEIEYRLRHHSGQYRWALARALPIHDDAGAIVRWMGTCTDIDDQKRIQDALRQSEEQFRLLYENAPIGIAHVDLEGRWTYANPKFAEISGYSPEELVGRSYLDVTPADERDQAVALQKGLLAGATDIDREGRILRKDGSVAWIRMTARMLCDESGKPRYGIVTFEDINERKQTEAALRESEDRFRATFENAPLGIGKTDLDGHFIRANPKILETLGYSLEEFLNLSLPDIVHPADREQMLVNFHRFVSGEIPTYVQEIRCIRKDGSLVWMSVTTAMRYVDGVPQYAIGMYEDVTARKRAEEDVQRALEHSYHLANHDALTGLANRARFNDRLIDALSYAKRDGHLVAVHLLDLDRFKSINDTLGHQIGDLLLKGVANRIKAQTRETDVVARLGGDEFVIIQTHLATPSAAMILAGKLVEELGRTFILDGQEVDSGASIGIALFPDDADTPERLVKLADLALYEAKSRGRYNFQFYRPEMGAAVEQAQKVDKDLRRALREGQFRLHYQPQFDLESNRISGIEVLLRWQHPERGLLTAEEFMQDAENASLTPAIGEWTLKTACRQHKKWIDMGLSAPLILNASLRQLRHPRFLQTLRDVLAETQLPPSLVQVETNESVLWDPKLPIDMLKEMKKIGVRFSLDGFGTEFAALSSLSRFPLDAIKPGHGLVKELPRHGTGAAVLHAMVDVAHSMNIAVCAGGVETADELSAVKEHGCDAAQGFLLGLPGSETEIDRLIDAELARG